MYTCYVNMIFVYDSNSAGPSKCAKSSRWARPDFDSRRSMVETMTSLMFRIRREFWLFFSYSILSTKSRNFVTNGQPSPTRMQTNCLIVCVRYLLRSGMSQRTKVYKKVCLFSFNWGWFFNSQHWIKAPNWITNHFSSLVLCSKWIGTENKRKTQ